MNVAPSYTNRVELLSEELSFLVGGKHSVVSRAVGRQRGGNCKHTSLCVTTDIWSQERAWEVAST